MFSKWRANKLLQVSFHFFCLKIYRQRNLRTKIYINLLKTLQKIYDGAFCENSSGHLVVKIFQKSPTVDVL